MADPAYEAAVKSTFEDKPLRTVLMIDDEFPTYNDLAAGYSHEKEKVFRQKDLADKLYAAFRKNNMLCDVENVATDVPLESIRKSDLIILDYHLGPEEGDSRRSIGIIRELASSTHFNTVVVFTAEPDLDKVWLEVIASLGGAWTSLPGELDGDAKQEWERLSDEGTLPGASLDAVMEFAQRREIRCLSPSVRLAAQEELVALGVPRKTCGAIIEALINVEMARRAGDYKGEPRNHAVGGYANENRWIQCKNTFIVVHRKGGELTEDDVDPAGILSSLSKSLLAWRPNLIQILVSEIQNVLEGEALISGDELLRHPATHASLWHFLLDSMGPIDTGAAPDVRAPLSALIDRILDGVKRRLSLDPDLLSLASDAMLGEVRDAGWNVDNWPTEVKKIEAVAEISRTKGLTTPAEVFFRLNSFFSTEEFRRTHITLGTLIQRKATRECFIVASPACDMTPRRPSEDQLWTGVIHPLRPVVCVHMHKVSAIDKALTYASTGKYIFVESGSEQIAFSIIPSPTPSYEVIFVRDAGAVSEADGRKAFSARRVGVVPSNAAESVDPNINDRGLLDDEFEVIGQLRSSNANRVLQMISQHLSRIGLDHISMPTG